MKVLFAVSEAVPYVKTGGLADVAGSLPQALQKKGMDVIVVLPFYQIIEEQCMDNINYLGYYYVDIGSQHQYVGVFRGEQKGVPYYFIDSKQYFGRKNLYGDEDDGERFLFFNKAVTLLLKYIGFAADIVHCNDWHTGFIPLYIKDFAKGDSFYKNISTVYTIHNIHYQGVFPKKILTEIGGLSEEYFQEEGVKYYDGINFMKAGIVYSDVINTVSRRYSEEIQYPFFGAGLEGLLEKYSYKLTGIVNGIDTEEYNPETDPFLPEHYSIKTLGKKRENKRELQKRMHLPEREVPIFAVVSRLVEIKGMDLLFHIGEELLQEDIQLVILGTGEEKYEEGFSYLQGKYPQKVAARFHFSEEEAHHIYGGADFLLMPSLTEPCGLAQQIGQRYGTIPIVRETGGLVDTVVPYNKYTGEGTGFSFGQINAHEFLFAIQRALEVYGTKEYESLVIQCMEQDNSWEKASKEYIRLYEKSKQRADSI